MEKRSNVVLVVDDEPAVAEAHARMLDELGYIAVTESIPEQVEPYLLRRPEVELVLLDIRMPRIDGLQLLYRIKARRPEIGVVIATVVNDLDLAIRATKSGAYNYLLKPLQPDRVEATFSSYLANQPRRLIRDPAFLPFITADPQFGEIFRRIKAFAQADVPMLLEGESGTGKEILARISHALSRRVSERFLAVNVAALSPSLFESELFGCARGAFTGAVRDREGYFEAAGAGTLFLDEIGEIDADQQKKLLRVLQNRTFCRVGDTREREVQARLVFATNRNLEEQVREGRFREDLYHRLSGFRVRIPPLRERPGDIDVLCRYFLEKYRSQFGRFLDGFEPEALELLRRYPFPGNVRELEGIISACVLLESSSTFRAATLPERIRWPELDALPDGKAGRIREVLQALKECGGNRTRAAALLGIDRSTLHRILREHENLRKKG